ncbi:NAD(P)/FAD-dependent oxidoreductase [Paenibacillus daejeonensis]|uniref:NAD(P)/FAD-dependent oxidoreductase n=1 Tax=Paenibacillus daejeonensis TaxID=135193 RepID=UPI00036A672E|nr:FAD-dependent oxidoreductase [Paenibacillus daejeonensis]
MNLQSGTYYWPATLPDPPTYPALSEDLVCDILIVGGGSSGAQSAYALANSGLRVVVIEKNTIGSGSTATNTALIQYSGEKMFTDLIHTFGEEATARHLQLLRQAIDQLETTAGNVAMDFEFRRRDTLYFASCDEDVAKLHKEYQYLKDHGCSLDFWDRKTVKAHYPFSHEAAIYSYGDAELNPFKFTHALLQDAAAKGVGIYEHTAMNGHRYDRERQRMIVTTRGGHHIDARYVIFAAGYEGIDIRKEPQASFVSTYTVTTEPIADLSSWYNRTLIWETARPYLYLRTTADDRVIIGGLDETTDIAEQRDNKLHHRQQQLMDALRQRFPDISFELAYANTAFYGGIRDGLPLIGQYDDYPHCYFIFAFGDNGTVYSQTLVNVIVDDIVQGYSPDMELYRQDRPVLNSVST